MPANVGLSVTVVAPAEATMPSLAIRSGNQLFVKNRCSPTPDARPWAGNPPTYYSD
jgi:hypothetical protein